MKHYTPQLQNAEKIVANFKLNNLLTGLAQIFRSSDTNWANIVDP